MPAPIDGQVISALARAEAKAQSKIAVSDLVVELNRIREADQRRYDELAQAVNRLGVMVAVLVDCAVGDPLKSEGTPDDKRAKFERLCAAKLAAAEKK